MSIEIVTPADVDPQDNAVIDRRHNSGEAIDEGEWVYLKSSDGKAYKAQADGTEEEAQVEGMAVSGAAAADLPIAIQTDGEVDGGFSSDEGTPLFLAPTAGAAATDIATDLSAGDHITVLGVINSSGNLDLSIFASGATKQA